MNVTNYQKGMTALQTFEARRDNIVKNARKLAPKIEAYDRAISTAGDHQNWEHAGTMQMLEEKLADMLRILDEVTANTKPRTVRK